MRPSNFQCEISTSATVCGLSIDIGLKVRFSVSWRLQLKLPKRIEFDMNSIRCGESIRIDYSN